jgi:hypothetical protein
MSKVIAPGERPVPDGNTTASPAPSKDRLAPVESVTRAVLPKKVDVAVSDAGLTLFQLVGAVATRESVLLASRFITRLFETIAAAAGGGVSRNVKVDPSSETSAARVAPLRHTLLSLKYDFAPI